jgi:hypothetical protein
MTSNIGLLRKEFLGNEYGEGKAGYSGSEIFRRGMAFYGQRNERY